MKPVIRGLLIALTVLVGLVEGSFLGFFIPYLYCRYVNPEWYQIGWIICFLTVPADAALSGAVGSFGTAGIWKWSERRRA